MAHQQRAERAQRFVEIGFQPFAQMTRQHRCAAAAGDRDLQRTAFDPRRHLEAAQRRVVDHVRPDPARVCGFGDDAVGVGVVGGGDHQPDAVQPVRAEQTIEVHDAAGFDQRGDFGIQCRRTDPHLGAGGQQGCDLAAGDHAAADHQHRPAAQIQEGREQRRNIGRLVVHRTVGRVPGWCRRGWLIRTVLHWRHDRVSAGEMGRFNLVPRRGCGK